MRHKSEIFAHLRSFLAVQFGRILCLLIMFAVPFAPQGPAFLSVITCPSKLTMLPYLSPKSCTPKSVVDCLSAICRPNWKSRSCTVLICLCFNCVCHSSRASTGECFLLSVGSFVARIIDELPICHALIFCSSALFGFSAVCLSI